MRAGVIVVVAVSLVLAALAALAPAALVDRGVAAATEGRLRLAEAGGTIWHGHGIVTDQPGNWQLPIAWRASPLSLLRGTVDVVLGEAPDGGAVQGGVSVSSGAIALSGVKALVPANVLRGLAAQGVVPALGGNLAIEVPALRYDGRAGDGGAEVRWERARVLINGTPAELGTVTARMNARGAEVAGTIGSTGGAVRIAGDFSLTASGGALNATITPGPDVSPDVARSIASLGVPDGTGGVRIAWRGAL